MMMIPAEVQHVSGGLKPVFTDEFWNLMGELDFLFMVWAEDFMGSLAS